MINTNSTCYTYDGGIVISKELGDKIIAAIAKILPELKGEDIVTTAKLIEAISSGQLYKLAYTFTWPNYGNVNDRGSRTDWPKPNEWIVTC
jgi:hypothetical protein